MSDQRLRIAIQKSGRLSERSLDLLTRCGLDFSRSKDRLFCYGRNMPIDLLLVRDDDIPEFLFEGICDLGIVGDNVATEHALGNDTNGDAARRVLGLGYGQCRLSLATSSSINYQSAADLQGKTIATTYPNLLRRFLEERNVVARIAVLSGSVEIAPRLGTADCICDLVSTGTTLAANNLVEVEVIMESQAALYARDLSGNSEKKKLYQRLLTRVEGVLQVDESKYVVFHAPRSALQMIGEILPSAEAPTVLPLAGDEKKVAVHILCRETLLWEHLEQLKSAGASAILVLPVEKMMA